MASVNFYLWGLSAEEIKALLEGGTLNALEAVVPLIPELRSKETVPITIASTMIEGCRTLQIFVGATPTKATELGLL